MAIRVKATFAEGVTREDITRTEEATPGAPSDGPPGSIGETQEMMENGRLVFINDFESHDAWEQFVAMARPTFEQVGVPFPEFEIENIQTESKTYTTSNFTNEHLTLSGDVLKQKAKKKAFLDAMSDDI